MKTKGIRNTSQFVNLKYDSQEYNELTMKEMITSCYTYGMLYNDYSFNRYIVPFKEKLTINVFNAVLNEHTKWLENNCTIEHNVYTDREGCTYNSLTIKE